MFDFINPCLKDLKSKFKFEMELEYLTHHHHLEEYLQKHNPNAHEHMLELIVRNPDFYKKLPAPVGAMKVIQSLSADYTIWAITARPWNVVKGTRDKMNEFYPAIGDNVLVAKDKVVARKGIGSLIHVEDHSDIIKKMADAGMNTLVMDWPYNRQLKPHEKIVRVKNMYEAEEVIRTTVRREQ